MEKVDREEIRLDLTKSLESMKQEFLKNATLCPKWREEQLKNLIKGLTEL